MSGLKKNHAAIAKEYNEISENAESVRKDLVKYDRAEVEFKEREKHFKGKIKKLTKTIHSDTLSLSESSTWIRNFDADVETRNVELSELTERLVKESAALEKVTNELLPKTRGFQEQIETKQRGLGPFLEKINKLESGITVAEGEYNELREQTTKYEVGLSDANTKLSTLKTNKLEKVSVLNVMHRNSLSRNVHRI
jgi:structural maintenance of chromosome 4